MSSPSSAERAGGRRGVALLGSTGSIGRQARRRPRGATRTRSGSSPSPPARNARAARRAGARLGRRPSRSPTSGSPAGPAAGHDRVGGADALEALATRDDVDLVVVAHRRRRQPAAGPRRAAGRQGRRDGQQGDARRRRPPRHAAGAAPGRRASPSTDPRDPFASPLAWLRPIDSEHSAIWQCLVGERMARRRRAGPDRVGRPVPRRDAGGARGGHAGAGAAPPDLDDGRQDHDRLGDARQQGPGGHRGALAVRCRLRRHRGRHPPAERRPLRRPVRRRLPQGPAGHPRHATPHPVRPDLPATAARRRRPRPTSSATARLDFRAPDEARFPALRIAREAGRLGPRASAALIAADDVAVARFLDGTLDFTGHPAPARGGRATGSARRRRPDPDVDDLVELDAEVRAAFATGPFGGTGMTGFVQSIITIVLFILILGGLVVIHELGHFVTARLAKVRVLEFGVGFPPRAKVLRIEGRDRSTRSTGCRSAASSSSRARTATTPTTRARSRAQRLADQAVDPRRRRAHERRCSRSSIFTGIALAGDARRRRHGRRRSSRTRRPRRPGSSRATSIVARRRRATYEFFGGAVAGRRPPRPGRRDRRPRPSSGTDGDARRRHRHAPAAEPRSTTDARRARHQPDRARRSTYFCGEYTGHDLGDGDPDRRAARRSDALGPDRRRARRARRRRSRPTRPRRRRSRVRSASRRRSATSSGNVGPILTLYVAGILSANLARREHPAVPAARRRPDADDRAQAALRRADQPPRRAADLRGRVRVPVRLPHLGHRRSTSSAASAAAGS